MISRSGQEEDFDAAKAKALKIGAVACYVVDLRREFIGKFLDFSNLPTPRFKQQMLTE